MDAEVISEMVERQREYYKSGETLPVKFRIDKLKKLREHIRLHEGEISEALKKDLGKSDFEGYMLSQIT